MANLSALTGSLFLFLSAVILIAEGHSRFTHYDPRVGHVCSSGAVYTEWSLWSACTPVHLSVSIVGNTSCGPGKRLSYRQRQLKTNQPTSPVSHPYYYFHSCQPKCFGEKLYKVETCSVGGHLSCNNNPSFGPCEFTGADAVCDTFINTHTKFHLVVGPSAIDPTNNVLSLTDGGANTDPFAYFGTLKLFEQSLTYKHCFSYKARLDPGTILYAVKLYVAMAPTDQIMILFAQAITEKNGIQGGKTCKSDVVLGCTYGATSTQSVLTQYSHEITDEEPFGLALMMIPQDKSPGFTGGEIDDVIVTEGPCN